MDAKIQVALIGALGGLVGGGVTVAASHYFGLEATRQELLQSARRDAYVEWLQVRELGRKASRLRETNPEEADSLLNEYQLKGSQVFGRIAVYGDRIVVETVATWMRNFEYPPCTDLAWEEEIAIYRSMRGSLLSEEQSVDDDDLSMILHGCSQPNAG